MSATCGPRASFVTTEFDRQHEISSITSRPRQELASRPCRAHRLDQRPPAEAKQILNQQIQKETGKALAPAVLNDSFSRLQVTYDPLRQQLLRAAHSAFDAGFLGRQMPDLSRIYDLNIAESSFDRRREEANPMTHHFVRPLFLSNIVRLIDLRRHIGQIAP